MARWASSFSVTVTVMNMTRCDDSDHLGVRTRTPSRLHDYSVTRVRVTVTVLTAGWGSLIADPYGDKPLSESSPFSSRSGCFSVPTKNICHFDCPPMSANVRNQSNQLPHNNTNLQQKDFGQRKERRFRSKVEDMLASMDRYA